MEQTHSVRQPAVLVIGGGIAGPVTAMALQKAGIESVIYEAHHGSAEGIGTFLTVASNGTQALRTVDVEIAGGFPTPTMVMWSGTGKRLGQTATGLHSEDGTAVSRTISRAALYQAVNDEARRRGIRIEQGKRLVDANATADGVLAIFDDGTQTAGELLIGCDGVHSTVRCLLDPAAPAPSYTGLINLGGYASGVSVASEPGVYNMIFGKHAFFGYVGAPGGEVWWFANVPQPVEPAPGELAAVDTADWHRRLAGLFSGDAGPAAGLIAATKHDLAASAVHTIPHLPTWHSDRMVVIGDAAHAPSPSSGQGASLAIEDAIVLAQCVRDAANVAQALTSFETRRRARAERIIKYAASVNSAKAAGPVGRIFRDALLPIILKTVASEKRTKWLFDYQIDWDGPLRVAA